MRAQTGAVILAAGAGSRMGNAPKPLIQRDGEPLVLRQIRLLAEVGVENIVVVLGYHAMQISEVLEKTRWSAADSPVARVALRWTINPAPDDGTASSLRCGLRRLPPGLSEIMVMLGDQPLLEAVDVEVMLAAWDARGEATRMVVPQYDQTPGHPIIFDGAVRQIVADGQTIPGWRRSHPEQLQRMIVEHPRYTTDLDTPQDLLRLQEGSGMTLELPGT